MKVIFGHLMFAVLYLQFSDGQEFALELDFLIVLPKAVIILGMFDKN